MDWASACRWRRRSCRTHWCRAPYARNGQREGERVYHFDRGSQYVAIRYNERLADAGIEPSAGSISDCKRNALAETINDQYKVELIHRRGHWKNREAVELAMLEWVSWLITTDNLSPSATSHQPKRRQTTGVSKPRASRQPHIPAAAAPQWVEL